MDIETAIEEALATPLPTTVPSRWKVPWPRPSTASWLGHNRPS